MSDEPVPLRAANVPWLAVGFRWAIIVGGLWAVLVVAQLKVHPADDPIGLVLFSSPFILPLYGFAVWVGVDRSPRALTFLPWGVAVEFFVHRRPQSRVKELSIPFEKLTGVRQLIPGTWVLSARSPDGATRRLYVSLTRENSSRLGTAWGAWSAESVANRASPPTD